MRRRACAYITRESPDGPQLLVFTHHVPDAPDVQVPGGTIEPDETPLEGALREAREETGLAQFGHLRVLAEEVWHGPEETVECYFVHLPLAQAAPDAWEHVVAAGEHDQGLVFSLFWTTLPDTSGLEPNMAEYVHLLR
ncbi:NUDIX domain-containing protein [Candidatus Bipolaricaulota bacterium]|nr:NUDIX domain-containing protein [Candidatus Bipolaricaulota bacterium]